MEKGFLTRWAERKKENQISIYSASFSASAKVSMGGRLTLSARNQSIFHKNYKEDERRVQTKSGLFRRGC